MLFLPASVKHAADCHEKMRKSLGINRHFYTYTPPRPLDAIDTELAEVTGEIQELLREVAGA